MVVSTLSWFVALFSAILPMRQRSVALIPLSFATSVFIGLTAWVVYAPPLEYTASKDRDLYEALYDRLGWSDFSFDFEPGYTFLQVVANTLGLSAPLFLTLVSLFFICTLFWLLYRRYALANSVLLLFLTLSFFPFMLGALNVTRQFVAAAILLLAFSQFQASSLTKFRQWRPLLLLIGWVALAALFHRSAAMVFMPIVLLALGLRLPHLVLVAMLLFLINLGGVGSSIWGGLVAMDRNVSENVWSFERGEIGFLYSGGVNRLDFALFSLLPILAHFGLKRIFVDHQAQDDTLVEYYFCLVFPLFVFSFVPYSDRLAFYGWLIWPVAACDYALRSSLLGTRMYLFLVCSAIGVVAIFQLYGLTATQLVQEALF